LGFRTVAIARGEDERPLAAKLGAHEYIDATAGDPAKRLAEMGGAKVVLATAPSGRAIQEMVGGLGVGGQLLGVAAAPDPISFEALSIVLARRSLQGFPR